MAKAMVLAETLKFFNPTWKIVAVISDQAPDGAININLHDYFDEVVSLEDLGFSKSWIFKHDVVELCTAVKGRALNWLLNNGANTVFYLDPDIAVLSKLTVLEHVMDKADISLTPHQLAHEMTEHSIRDNEICSLKHGTYNLGYLGVKNSKNGLAFARWWEDRLLSFCYDDIPNGLFTDQRWCDLVPSLFEGVAIIKDPGCNVSSWNLSCRKLETDGLGNIHVNGSPLKFYHFSKLGELGFTMTARYAGNNFHVFSLWYWYNNKVQNLSNLLNEKIGSELERYWFFGRFENGNPIPKNARVLYRQRPDLQTAFGNPFGDEYWNWFCANVTA